MASFLPISLTEKLTVKEASSLKMLSFNMRWLLVIHYSWIESVLKGFPECFRNAIINLLPSGISDKLADASMLTERNSKIHSKFAALFLLQGLKEKIYPDYVIDEMFLPVSSINILLYLKVKLRMQLIDFLGLYDLANELHMVVSQSRLQEINQILSKKKRLFLNYCMTHPLKYSDKCRFLATWDGSEARLRHHIHSQGLIFLGKALAQENASLLWHLLRRFDVQRAYLIEKSIKESQHAKNSEYFKNYVIKCIKVVVQ
ncbi:MAG: hypothetical protein RSB82_00265 [Victivallaceae bacterium]